MSVTLGEIVNSKAGRDTDRSFTVVKIIDELYVLISDGDLRKIEKPKRKKLKHLVLTGVIIDSLNEKLENMLKVTNAEIRKMLALYMSGNAVKGEESNNIDK